MGVVIRPHNSQTTLSPRLVLQFQEFLAKGQMILTKRTPPSCIPPQLASTAFPKTCTFTFKGCGEV